MKLSELKRKARPVLVPWELEAGKIVDIEVVYDPSLMTTGALEPENDSQTLIEFWRAQILKFVKKWDITDEEGVMIPLTEESLKTNIESAMLQAILLKIQDDARPNLTSTTIT